MLDTPALSALVISTLDEAKALDIKQIDVRKLTDITDEMIVCHGTSDRHVKALTRHVVDALTKQDCKPAGIEGEEEGEWILIDLVDVLVHIMKREAREHYDLESLWDQRLARSNKDQADHDQARQNA